MSYYEQNREIRLKKAIEYYHKNKEKVSDYFKKWYQKQKELREPKPRPKKYKTKKSLIKAKTNTFITFD